jgi:hypothetical protein
MKSLPLLAAMLLSASAFAQITVDTTTFPGIWSSPRHTYLFKKDGTWTMTPEFPGVTSGKWTIKGTEFTQTVAGGKPTIYTITKLTEEEIVFTDGKGTKFRMERIRVE